MTRIESMMRSIAIGAALAVSAITIADDAAAQDTSEATQTIAHNAELAAMFAADQGERKDLMERWDSRTGEENNAAALALSTGDRQRREVLNKMLGRGEVRTGKDFYHAAFIFQHGGTADDYLRAHTLSVTALAKGYKEAAWISAASLDRYLRKIGQPQIFGTQYRIVEGRRVQEEFASELVTDVERSALSVPTIQEKRTENLGVE